MNQIANAIIILIVIVAAVVVGLVVLAGISYLIARWRY